jgi:hypothetical protein
VISAAVRHAARTSVLIGRSDASLTLSRPAPDTVLCRGHQPMEGSPTMIAATPSSGGRRAAALDTARQLAASGDPVPRSTWVNLVKEGTGYRVTLPAGVDAQAWALTVLEGSDLLAELAEAARAEQEAAARKRELAVRAVRGHYAPVAVIAAAAGVSPQALRAWAGS